MLETWSVAGEEINNYPKSSALENRRHVSFTAQETSSQFKLPLAWRAAGDDGRDSASGAVARGSQPYFDIRCSLFWEVELLPIAKELLTGKKSEYVRLRLPYLK